MYMVSPAVKTPNAMRRSFSDPALNFGASSEVVLMSGALGTKSQVAMCR